MNCINLNLPKKRKDGVSLMKSTKGEALWLRMLKRRLPVLEWAPRYERSAAVADLVAGITLGLTLVPQSIAYASLADLPVQYGLYSSFVGTILYAALGTVREVSIGPTSLMALFTLQVCSGRPVEYVILLTFLSGIVVLLLGLLRLGFMVELISPAVTSGFTSAAAAIVVVAQLKGLLGLSFMAETVPDNLQLVATHWPQVRKTDAALAAVCCVSLLLLRKLKDVRVSPKRPGLAKALWLVSIGRNALVVLLASSAAYLLHNPEKPLFKLSGRVEPGLPRLSVPPFSVQEGNVTVPFSGMVRELGAGVIMLPIVMVLANIAIAKAFANGGRVDATQEMVTLGLCNVAGAFVHAMPTCGAISRSAVSHSSGVRTPAAGVYSGIITLLALIFLTPYFYFIPKACLASVLVCAVIFMIDIPIMFRLWKRDRCEWFVLMVTLVLGLLWTVELAVLAGALASLALLLRAVMRPPLHVHALKGRVGGGEVCRVRVGLGVVYCNAELVSRHVLRAAARAAPRPVLLDCSQLAVLDFAAEQVLQRLLKTFQDSNQKLIFYNVNPDIVKNLERIEGVDQRTFRVNTVAEALAIAEDKKPEQEETTALLSREEAHVDANV